jgi:hypothetical protein
MPSLLTNPFALSIVALLATIILVLLVIPRLFGLFKQNSFTGRPESTYNDMLNDRVRIRIRSLDASELRTFEAPNPLGEEIERRLFAYRREQRQITITVVYNHHHGGA